MTAKVNVNKQAKDEILRCLDDIRYQVDNMHVNHQIPGGECAKVWSALEEAKYQVGRISDE